jgi:molybdopterin-guanine dinucleotide biosynthesis protein A
MPVVAAKITTVRDGGSCPRGGAGCGVCGSLRDAFELTEETEPGARKDTQRLLASGAKQVFWLRVRKECLEAGLRALIERLPRGVPAVLEGNSVRLVLQPSLFAVMRDAESSSCKESCQEVIELADVVIERQGSGWQLAPERLVFAKGRWHLRWPASAVILAGGGSTRMGFDKALLPFGGVPLIQHLVDDLRPRFDGLLVGASDVEKYRFLALPVVPDRQRDMGPLEGLRVCLEASPFELNFVTACDVPRVDPSLINRLFRAIEDADVAVPVSAEGRPEPLLALYRRDAHRIATQVIASGERKLRALLARLKVREIPLGQAPWYHNLNTVDDYRRALVTAMPEKAK